MGETRGIGRWAAVSSVALLTLLAVSAVHWPRPEPFANTTGEVLPATGVMVQVWLSTADRRLRLAQQPDVMAEERGADTGTADVVIDLAHTYQTMTGFGAALTDSSAWLIRNKMSALQRAALLHEMFGPPPGLDFNMLRITIGASDFSLQHYTLDDMPAGQTDPGLQHFNVAVAQRNVIPVLQDILAIHPGLRIIASPWSAPAWMKTSANLISGSLLEQYEPNYAAYLVHFLDAFKGYGIPIFALTLQNEPAFEPLTYPGMELTADARARIIGQYLGPALAARKPKTLILGWDHNWDAPNQPLSVLADPTANRYVAGIAWHCYAGDPSAQTTVHRAYPGKDAYLTECSGGDWPSAKNGELLLFARNILMMSIKNWARGAVYWNLVLDEDHGPHAGGCDQCKGVVTVDAQTGEISRNDEYYAFAHFSRFVLPGAVRVKSGNTQTGVHQVAFQNPDHGSVVLVAVNGNAKATRLSVEQGDVRFQYDLPANSVATFEWSPGAPDAPAPAASVAR
ncbi:glycoside hydrolase family 30 beta sandwich domain-containing protein [Rhodanobacter sp. 115]|uniref:glycoside hydrolase family 30 protein n=1 Tax=Rhodanobacter sp. FW021-MT20 TaxID=1162282 RepID=UPI000260C635|nr:glycoside hydrolase family 30 beta sandwich domain-containing protein [Rhodanobacter sp. 115]EIL87067.1 glycoside hydrolase family protein [Rhodanobacter sp. 115]